MKTRIVLIGPPASGKGTQASLLGAAFGIPHTSTGAMLRAERSKGTSLGIEADSYTSRGLLFPDDLAIRVISQWLHGHARFILDGFPRTVGQARVFDTLLKERKLELSVVYLLDLPDSEVRIRMLGRLTCENCGSVFNEHFHDIDIGTPCPQCGGVLTRRADDTMEALEHRLAQYREYTIPVINYYRTEGLLRIIDATSRRDIVFKSLYDDIAEVE